MESNLLTISAFQIYSTGIRDQINIMVDRLWIKDNRVFFRVVEELLPNKKYFRKEQGTNVFSIIREDLLSIRCRLYF
ncbi:MAG: hypothetical protein ACFFCV_10575 [Promethearchaeota archaeon]